MTFLALLLLSILLISIGFIVYKLFWPWTHKRSLHKHSLNPFADYISETTRVSKGLK